MYQEIIVQFDNYLLQSTTSGQSPLGVKNAFKKAFYFKHICQYFCDDKVSSVLEFSVAVDGHAKLLYYDVFAP